MIQIEINKDLKKKFEDDGYLILPQFLDTNKIDSIEYPGRPRNETNLSERIKEPADRRDISAGRHSVVSLH